jgi:hypothetical protein
MMTIFIVGTLMVVASILPDIKGKGGKAHQRGNNYLKKRKL